jgi:hypothetical protein
MSLGCQSGRPRTSTALERIGAETLRRASAAGVCYHLASASRNAPGPLAQSCFVVVGSQRGVARISGRKASDPQAGRAEGRADRYVRSYQSMVWRRPARNSVRARKPK